MDTNVDNQSENRVWMIILGAILILLGILTIGTRVFFSTSAIWLFGLFLLGAGVIQFIQAFFRRQLGDFFLYLISGVLAVLMGGFMVLNPTASLLTVSFLLGVFFFVVGTVQIFSVIFTRPGNWILGIASGLIGIGLAVLMYNNWPVSGLSAFGWFIGTLLIASGFMSIGSTFQTKTLTSEEISNRRQQVSYSHEIKGGDKKNE